MKQGLHVIELGRLPRLAAAGADVPAPWMGVLDVLRMVEGHLPEPVERRPLGIVGVEALLRAAPEDATSVLQGVRAGLLEARRYFTWKEIPIVVLIDATVDDPSDGSGLYVVSGERRWPLGPLLGTRLAPVTSKNDGWWWAPQVG
jgi:hypothetical protein